MNVKECGAVALFSDFSWLVAFFRSPEDAYETRALSHVLASPSRVALSFTPPRVCAFRSFTTKDELGKAAPQLLTPGLTGESSESFSASEDEGQRECQASDSDSDGPVLYTDDDDDDDDEDGSGESKTFQEGGREVHGGQKQVPSEKTKASSGTRHLMFSFPSSAFLRVEVCIF